MIDDLDRIMQVMEAAFDPAFGEAWNRTQVAGALAMPNTHYQLAALPAGAQHDDAAAGFVLSRSVLDEEELLLIAVVPEFRGRGVGAQLIDALCADAAERGILRVFLEMRDGNPAEKLYRAKGFKPIGRRRDYYRGNGSQRYDAVTFSRKLLCAESPNPPATTTSQ